MKQWITLLALTLNGALLNAQGIGLGTNTPHSSALMDLTSMNKGILVPRMSTMQRNAIPSPAKGLMVFDNDQSGFYYFNGNNWAAMGGGGSGGGVFEVTSGAVHNTGNLAADHFLFGHATMPANGEYFNDKFFYFNKFFGAFRAGEVDDGEDAWAPKNLGFYSAALGFNNIASGIGSMAFGRINNATGNQSFAAGDANKASNAQSIAMGLSNAANGEYSIAMGALNRADGNPSIAMGVGNIAKTKDAVVVGQYNDTSAMVSGPAASQPLDPLFTIGNGAGNNTRSNALTVFRSGQLALGTNSPASLVHFKGNSSTGGYAHLKLEETDPGDYARLNFANADNVKPWTLAANSTNDLSEVFFNVYKETTGNILSVSNYYSVIMGKNNTRIQGDAQFMAGEGNYAGNHGAIALGYANYSSGYRSVAIGVGTKATSFNSTALGTFNETTNMTSPLSAISTDALFVVGNGSADNARKNALTILRNGRVGIGTANPQHLTHLWGNGNMGSGQLVVEETESGDGARISFRNSARASNFWDLYGFTSTVSSQAFFNVFNNGFGNVLSLRGDGVGYLAGNLVLTSDASLKKDIVPFTGSELKLQRINAYHYHWKDEKKDKSLQTGLLAQEIEEVFPELVYTDADGYKGVNYIGLIPHLLEAVKTLQKQNDMLEKRLKSLEK